MVYFNTAVYGGNEYGKSGHLSVLTSLKHLMMRLKCIFFRASFLHLFKILIACRALQLRYFEMKKKIVLNNAFKESKGLYA